MPVFPFDPGERSEYADGYYGLVGRVLALALSYEQSIKALAALLAVRAKPETLFGNQKKYKRMLSKVYRKNSLYRNLENACSGLGFKDGIKTVLHDARVMRNFVAHELAIIVDENDKDSLAYITENVEQAAKKLAQGEIVVTTLLNLLTGDEVFAGDAGARKRDQIVAWVCEMDE